MAETLEIKGLERLPGVKLGVPTTETPMKMNDLFDRYERECMPELEDRTRRDYKGILGKLREEFGEQESEAIKPRHVVAFLDVPTGRIHRNRMVTILSTVYKKAIYKWCISDDLRNPCDKVERWPTKPRTRYVTNEEFAKSRAMFPDRVQIAMDLAVLLGQRQGDIVGLTWKMVHTVGVPRDKWHVEVKQTKTGKHLGISITPAVEAVLRRARVLEPNWPHQFVLRTKFGKRYTNDGFRALWQRCQRKWIAAGGAPYHFHDLRAKAGSDSPTVEHAFALLGHLNISMTKRVYERAMRMVEPSA